MDHTDKSFLFALLMIHFWFKCGKLIFICKLDYQQKYHPEKMMVSEHFFTQKVRINTKSINMAFLALNNQYS